jgi:hypothetical protein
VAALSKAEVAAMAEEATVDALRRPRAGNGLPRDDRGHLKIPFVSNVLGVDVTVEHLGLAEGNSIPAMSTRGGIRQAIRVLNLPMPELPAAALQRAEAPAG